VPYKRTLTAWYRQTEGKKGGGNGDKIISGHLANGEKGAHVLLIQKASNLRDQKYCNGGGD